MASHCSAPMRRNDIPYRYLRIKDGMGGWHAFSSANMASHSR